MKLKKLQKIPFCFLTSVHMYIHAVKYFLNIKMQSSIIIYRSFRKKRESFCFKKLMKNK